jgi:YegS/Rv2252/BmrU family lipid kinase
MKALLVANPNAGGIGGEAGAVRLAQRLQEAGLAVHPIPAGVIGEVDDALRQAIQREPKGHVRVVVAGGDGTIHAALPVVVEAGVPLAILPVGSVNVLARELGIPRQLDAAIAVARDGMPRRVDVGLANGRPFALMAGIGFDAAVVRSVARPVKRLVGSFAYVASGLRLFVGYRPGRFLIFADGRQIEAQAWLAVVANAARYTYGWRIAPARIDDGWLDLCLFRGESAAERIGQVISVLRGRHSTHPGVEHLRARQFRFECEPPAPLQLDGDPAGTTPVEVHILRSALTVLVPMNSTHERTVTAG